MVVPSAGDLSRTLRGHLMDEEVGQELCLVVIDGLGSGGQDQEL